MNFDILKNWIKFGFQNYNSFVIFILAIIITVAIIIITIRQIKSLRENSLVKISTSGDEFVDEDLEDISQSISERDYYQNTNK